LYYRHHQTQRDLANKFYIMIIICKRASCNILINTHASCDSYKWSEWKGYRNE